MLLVIMGCLNRSQFGVVLLGRGLLLGVGSRAQLLGSRRLAGSGGRPV